MNNITSKWTDFTCEKQVPPCSFLTCPSPAHMCLHPPRLQSFFTSRSLTLQTTPNFISNVHPSASRSLFPSHYNKIHHNAGPNNSQPHSCTATQALTTRTYSPLATTSPPANLPAQPRLPRPQPAQNPPNRYRALQPATASAPRQANGEPSRARRCARPSHESRERIGESRGREAGVDEAAGL